MSRRSQLRQEAAHLRGRIDRHACLVRQHVDSLMHQVCVLTCSPAALPVAFACGVLAGRVRLSGLKRAYGFLADQADPVKAVKALQIVSGLIGSAVR